MMKTKELLQSLSEKRYFHVVCVSVFLLYCFFQIQATIVLLAHRRETVRSYALGLMYPRDYFPLVGHKPADEAVIQHYKNVFHQLAQLDPGRADLYGLEGFCAYQLGKKKEAIDLYKKAKSIHPDFFWYRYNLTALYLEEGDSDTALEEIKSALQLPLEPTLKYILGAKRTYVRLLMAQGQASLNISKQLKEGYAEGLKLLVALKKSKFEKRTDRLDLPEFKLYAY